MPHTTNTPSAHIHRLGTAAPRPPAGLRAWLPVCVDLFAALAWWG